jgi:hypothetical protein
MSKTPFFMDIFIIRTSFIQSGLELSIRRTQVFTKISRVTEPDFICFSLIRTDLSLILGKMPSADILQS